MFQKRLLSLTMMLLIAAACGGSDSDTEGVATLSDNTVTQTQTDQTEGTDSENQSEGNNDEVLIPVGGEASGPATTETSSTDDSTEDTQLTETVSDETIDTAAIAEMSEEEIGLSFASCLRAQGIEANDPAINENGRVNLRSIFPENVGPLGGGDQPPEFEAAMEVCGVYLEGFSGRGGSGVDPTQLQDTLLEFAQCVRENGYDLPDPDFTNLRPGGVNSIFGSIDQSDPAFQDASEACSDLLGNFGRRLGGGGGGPGTNSSSNDGS